MKMAIQTIIIIGTLITGVFIGLYLWPMLNPKVPPAIPPTTTDEQSNTPALNQAASNHTKKDTTRVTDFTSCIAADNTVIESYPRQCETEAGIQFVENIGNALEEKDIITVNTPRPNTVVTSPLKITGEARGPWFFEGNFPMHITDSNDNVLGTGLLTAKSDWMVEDFIEFEGVLEFATPDTKTGTLTLKRNNASELPENDDLLIIPISFK